MRGTAGGDEACAYCDESGYVTLKGAHGALAVIECPHDGAKLREVEERTGRERV